MHHAASEHKAPTRRRKALLRKALLRRALRALTAPAPVLAAALSFAAANHAAAESVAPNAASYGYKFYVGGVLIGKAWLSATFEKDAYISQASLETDGVAGWFVAATVMANAKGAMAPKSPAPKQLDVKGVTEGAPWTMTIAYENGAPGRVTSEPPFRKKPYEIDPAQQHGALDPISAVIAAMKPGKGAGCERTIPIFDGRKRYDVVLGEPIKEGESQAGYPMVECKGLWRRVGGFKPKMMKKPNIEFTARFEQRDGLTVPTKVWGDTEFGGAVAVIRK